MLNIASAIALGQALLARRRRDKEASEAEKKAGKRLKKVTEAAVEAWAQRQRMESALPALSGEQKRGLDVSADQGWSALRKNLESHADLPAEVSKKAADARGLLQLLFKDGLGFLNWPYAEQHTMMALLIKRIDDEGLSRRLDSICGPEFLANIRANQARYGAMLQAGAGPGSDVSLADLVRTVADAVVDYAVSVCATVDRKDPETIQKARELLSPIDELRSQQARPATPPAPTPPAPSPSPAP